MDGVREMIGRPLLAVISDQNALVVPPRGRLLRPRLEGAQGLGSTAARAELLRRKPAGGPAMAGIVSNDREEALSKAGALIVYDPLIDDGRTAPHDYRFTTTWALPIAY
jgi:hypothetical protein